MTLINEPCKVKMAGLAKINPGDSEFYNKLVHVLTARSLTAWKYLETSDPVYLEHLNHLDFDLKRMLFIDEDNRN